jgi:two-component sensor histidine kinase
MRVRIAEQIQSLQSLSEELARSGDSQRIMFRELDHRVRNNLAGLASLIDLSRQNASGITDFAESIRGRVHAMSVVHSMLSQEHWDPIDLAGMITLLVPPGSKGTLEMEQNPNVLVPSQQATACGMVFQEMMANSLKYGAWSSGGVVHVIWSAPEVEEDGTRRLSIHWRESGGPRITGEVSPGTGTGLIEGFVTHELGGSLELRYEAEGVRHDLVFRFKPNRS